MKTSHTDIQGDSQLEGYTTQLPPRKASQLEGLFP